VYAFRGRPKKRGRVGKEKTTSPRAEGTGEGGYNSACGTSNGKFLHLNDKIIEFSTILATYEVNYFSIEVRNAPARTRQIRAELNRVIPVMKNLISEAIGIRMKNPDPDGLLAMQYAGKITEIEILVAEAPSIEELDIQQKNCTDCIFFEALTNRIKVQVGKFQKKPYFS